MTTDQLTVSATFPAHAASVVVARRLVADTLRAWDLAALTDDFTLIADELVANAIRHAGTPVHVSVRRTAGTVMIEVADGSEVLPTVFLPQPTELGHRGMYLVDCLSHRWGVLRRPGGKTVWAELGLPRATGD